jgi:hypothetical protein
MVRRTPGYVKLWFAAIAATGLVGMFSLLAPAVASAQNADLFPNLGNELCLNSTSGGSVSMGNCNGANDWYLAVGNPPDYPYALVVDRHTGLCLQATHITLGNVYTRTCGGSVYQEWVTPDTSNQTWGPYVNKGTGQCLVGATAGGGAYMRDCRTGDVKQQWHALPFG